MVTFQVYLVQGYQAACDSRSATRAVTVSFLFFTQILSQLGFSCLRFSSVTGLFFISPAILLLLIYFGGVSMRCFLLDVVRAARLSGEPAADSKHETFDLGVRGRRVDGSPRGPF